MPGAEKYLASTKEGMRRPIKLWDKAFFQIKSKFHPVGLSTAKRKKRGVGTAEMCSLCRCPPLALRTTKIVRDFAVSKDHVIIKYV